MNILTKNTTHIEAVRKLAATQMQMVCESINWTEKQYCEHQFEEYELFVAEVAKEYPARYHQLRYSPVFRGFFNNEWATRNEQDFLPYTYDVKYDIELATDEYLFIHHYITLVNDDAFYTRFIGILKLI